MEGQEYKRILAGNPAGDFAGRSSELEHIVALAAGHDAAIVAGAPGVGVSELLKHAYDRLFCTQGAIVPFYFSLVFSGETAEQTARRFLHQFLLQTTAFRRRDESILNWFPDLWELAELAVPADGYWVDRLVSKFSPAQPPSDEDAVFKTCLGAPVRAAASGARVFVMIDNVHAAAHSAEAARLLGQIGNIFDGSGVPFILGGYRRFAFGPLEGERIVLEPLPFGDVAAVVERYAKRYSVRINDETRDLIANQLGSNLDFIRFLFQSSAEKNAHLDNFLNVEKMYVQEIFGGRIRRHYDALIDSIASGEELQKSIVSLLDVAATLGTKQLSIESWLKRMAVSEKEFDRILDLLNIHELIRVTGGRVEAMDGGVVLGDYVASRFKLEVAGENRAAIFGESVAAYLKRAPRIMADYYRSLASLGLRELLASFALQKVPTGAIDYGFFADHYKGLPDEEIMTGLRADEASVRLPQIVYTADAADFYKPLGEISEKDRSAVALGFQEGRYSDEDEIVWLVAEIDSKTEAPRETAEFWCDRLEMAALMCNFQNHKVWIIAPEGFTPDAIDLLRERGAFGSSRRQINFLRRFLKPNGELKGPGDGDEYEMVVPMDDESELIAAHTLEEIARRHNVSAKAINQMKTAMLEASINASEHSLSPDRRIRQKFQVHDDRITITISNRGLRLSDRKVKPEAGETDEPTEQRRGWGLKLIEKLMDEVKIERTDDGTSISMTKFLREEVVA